MLLSMHVHFLIITYIHISCIFSELISQYTSVRMTQFFYILIYSINMKVYCYCPISNCYSLTLNCYCLTLNCCCVTFPTVTVWLFQPLLFDFELLLSNFQLLLSDTSRKLINTNGNIKGIFSSVNFRGILPTELFPRYIPTELPWEKNLKQSKKKRWRVIFTNGKYRRKISSVIPLVNCEHCSSCQLQRESPTKFSVGISQRVLFGGFLKKFN